MDIRQRTVGPEFVEKQRSHPGLLLVVRSERLLLLADDHLDEGRRRPGAGRRLVEGSDESDATDS